MYFRELELGEELYGLLQKIAQEEFEAAIAEVNTEYDKQCFGVDEWELDYAV